MATRNGGDGGWLRRGNLTASQINLRTDEDRSQDGERNHAAERASIAAFETTFVADTLGPSPDLLLHYNFEPYTQLNSTTIMDDSGNQNHGALNGDAALTAGGISGSALTLDGDNDFLNSGDIDLLDPFTVSLWFKRANETSSSTNHNVNNVLVAQSSNGDNDNLEIGTQGSNVEIYLDTQDQDGPNPFAIDSGIANDEWNHLVLIYDQSLTEEMSLYVNNELVTSESQWGGLLDGSASSPLTFGIARPDRGDPWGDFHGLLDEIQIYTRALEWYEVDFLYRNPGQVVRLIPEPTTLLIWSLLAGLGIGAGWWRRKR
jgi:hypothetical protein